MYFPDWFSEEYGPTIFRMDPYIQGGNAIDDDDDDGDGEDDEVLESI